MRPAGKRPLVLGRELREIAALINAIRTGLDGLE